MESNDKQSILKRFESMFDKLDIMIEKFTNDVNILEGMKYEYLEFDKAIKSLMNHDNDNIKEELKKDNSLIKIEGKKEEPKEHIKKEESRESIDKKDMKIEVTKATERPKTPIKVEVTKFTERSKTPIRVAKQSDRSKTPVNIRDNKTPVKNQPPTTKTNKAENNLSARSIDKSARESKKSILNIKEVKKEETKKEEVKKQEIKKEEKKDNKKEEKKKEINNTIKTEPKKSVIVPKIEINQKIKTSEIIEETKDDNSKLENNTKNKRPLTKIDTQDQVETRQSSIAGSEEKLVIDKPILVEENSKETKSHNIENKEIVKIDQISEDKEDKLAIEEKIEIKDNCEGVNKEDAAANEKEPEGEDNQQDTDKFDTIKELIIVEANISEFKNLCFSDKRLECLYQILMSR
jgi:hypothetical protein